ncbi:MAG TPA: WbuC family cupin fold metalloprotein [Terriglobia bacterium]|jgi:cupin fold WbuC family metalloprotein
MEMIKPGFERVSEFATISLHDSALAITPDIIRSKSKDAQLNPRRREILALHRGNDDRLQRMLNAIQPGSYVRPHRHAAPPKAELLILLSGSMAFMSFLDDGTPDTKNFVFLHQTKGALAVDCREGIWHTFFALEPDTVVCEVKAGPYDPAAAKEFAPWAPSENDPAAHSYLASLEQRFRESCG